MIDDPGRDRRASERPTVLVVEDDPDAREVLGHLLDLHGYQPLAAANGREALDVLHRASALPCLILLDLRMPVMDGYRFRELQREDPAIAGIPVVVVSADAGVKQELPRLGAAAYVPKPIEVAPLMRAIEVACGPPPAPAGAAA